MKHKYMLTYLSTYIQAYIHTPFLHTYRHTFALPYDTGIWNPWLFNTQATKIHTKRSQWIWEDPKQMGWAMLVWKLVNGLVCGCLHQQLGLSIVWIDCQKTNSNWSQERPSPPPPSTQWRMAIISLQSHPHYHKAFEYMHNNLQSRLTIIRQ